MTLVNFDQNFFGRKAILDVLRKRILGLKEGYRQNVALLGSRYIGKTVIARKLIAEHDDNDVIIIYLDLENRDFTYFTTQFTKSLLYHFLKVENLPLHEDLKLLCESARGRIPQTVGLVEAVSALVREGKFLESYHALLSLPEIFAQETNKLTVLIFDEFQQLENFPIPDVFQELGKRIMTQKSSLYIVTSSYEAQAEAILSEKLSLLFGNFETLRLGVFDFSNSQQLIDRNLNEIKIGLQLKNFLVDFTGGHPLYINILSQELICLSGVYRQDEIYAPIVTQSIENVVFNPWGVISRHFELIISELSRGKAACSAVALLIALAQGRHRVVDLVEYLGMKPAQVNQRINALLDADVIEKNGNYFHFKDKLFRYWVKYVYERRLRAIDLEPGRQRKQFKEEINKSVNDFQMVARKDLSMRVVDLMQKFDSESFSLSGRRYKLSAFRDIVPVKLRLGAGAFVDAIQAQGDEGQWLVVIKKDPVHDNELNSILEEVKRMSPKPARCVVVSLSGLDDSAKIRALQEKLWVWNEDELNSLMHLYDEPYIVR